MLAEPLRPFAGRGWALGEHGVAGDTLEHAIHAIDHHGRRAEALVQYTRGQRTELLVQGVEDLGHAAPPAVDGLLDVAHAEKRSLAAADHALGKGPQHAPLQGRGVLELVQKQVRHLAVESVDDLFQSLADGPFAQPPRDIFEPQRPLAGLETLIRLVETFQQVIGGLGLIGKAGQQHRLGMFDQGAINLQDVGRNGVAVEQFAAVKDFRPQSLAEETLPVVAPRAGQVLGTGLFIARPRQRHMLQCLDGHRQLGRRELLLPRQRLPGLGRGLAEDRIQGRHQRGNLLAHRARGLALGQQVHQPQDVLRLLALEHRADGLRADCRVLDLVGDRPAGRETQLQAETLRDLHKETIQGADPQAVQVADHLTQQAPAAVAV